MNFIEKIGGALSDAFNTLADKNRKFADINRLRNTIDINEKGKAEAYTALGKYYYSNLPSNEETEIYFDIIKKADAAIKKATSKIEEINEEEACAVETKCEEACSEASDEETSEEADIQPIEEDLLDADEEEAKEEINQDEAKTEEKIPWD